LECKATRNLHTNDPPKLFLYCQKNEDVGVDLPPRILKSNEWMARWQEQEDGAMRNFSIIELAQEKVKEMRRLGVPFIPLEAKRINAKCLGSMPSVG
jgi:hypothetical protein